MRALAIAALAALGAFAAATADARPFNDPRGRLTLDVPRGWEVDNQNLRADDTASVVPMFTPQYDCYVIAFPNPGTATNTPFEVKHHTEDAAHFTPERWVAVASGVPAAFPDGSAELVSQSVDNTNYWPIQRAVLRGEKGLVHGALQLRPGTDLVTFCTSVNGQAGAEAFDAVMRSVGTASDAQLQEQATQQEAEYNANQAAADAAQQQQGEQNSGNNRRRNN